MRATEWPSEELILDMPKAEVHVHLEGCLEAADLAAFAREAGEPPPVDPEHPFAVEDLESLLDLLDVACGLVRTPQQLQVTAYRFAQREADSGVGYADLIVNPIHWPAWSHDLNGFVGAINLGLTEAERDGLPPVGLCVSLFRSQTSAEALELVEWLLERRHPRVVALSIDGNEASVGRTGPRFAEAFRRAADAGLHRTVHAGESSGPEGVRDAIDLLMADRIDHGVRAVEDPDLVRELADRAIPLGVCPGSNVTLGLYRDRESHPAEALRRAGVPLSINTDDPALLGTTLASEYMESVRTYGWDPEATRDVARTSIVSSFCPEELRDELLARLAEWHPAMPDEMLAAPEELGSQNDHNEGKR
jgi:adenosine deaminase